MGDFNTPLTPMDTSTEQKISKETQTSNDTMDQLDLIDICRRFHPQTMNLTFFLKCTRNILQDTPCSVTQSCPTLCNPMDYSPPGSSVHGISQARILEGVAVSFFRGSSQPRDWTQGWNLLLLLGRQILYHRATREAP